MMCLEMDRGSSGSANSHCDDGYEEDEEIFLPLTDLARKQYCSYLENKLRQNLTSWQRKDPVIADSSIVAAHVQECCRLLEESAIRACMHAPSYRRSMLAIIATVQHNTEECRLDNELQRLITKAETESRNKQSAAVTTSVSVALVSTGTQTDRTLVVVRQKAIDDSVPQLEASSAAFTGNHTNELSLEQKIEMFQQRLNRKNAAVTAPFNKRLKHRQRICFKERQHRCSATGTSPMLLSHTEKVPSPHIPLSHEKGIDYVQVTPSEVAVSTLVASHQPEQDDIIAREMAQLFSEEKTELDDLLGIDPNEEPDDPQVCSILKEIERAKLPHETKAVTPKRTHVTPPSPHADFTETELGINQRSHSPLMTPPTKTAETTYTGRQKAAMHKDLRHSLWPCEWFMQRRRLSASLNRLVEEDFRWHELIKWKFTTLFGDDSDDEFAACSPSIELDEVLIGSCIKRISPWMVKHLMKPLNDGLIANRFLFKKLAKRLAYSIVLECQYPDERVIKRAVEEFFCLHQAVLSVDDLEHIPNISRIADDSIFRD